MNLKIVMVLSSMISVSSSDFYSGIYNVYCVLHNAHCVEKSLCKEGKRTEKQGGVGSSGWRKEGLRLRT